MCDFSCGLSGGMTFQRDNYFGGGRAYIRRRGHAPGDACELWARNSAGDTTKTVIEFCPWCGRRLDGKEAAQ